MYPPTRSFFVGGRQVKNSLFIFTFTVNMLVNSLNLPFALFVFIWTILEPKIKKCKVKVHLSSLLSVHRSPFFGSGFSQKAGKCDGRKKSRTEGSGRLFKQPQQSAKVPAEQNEVLFFMGVYIEIPLNNFSNRISKRCYAIFRLGTGRRRATAQLGAT